MAFALRFAVVALAAVAVQVYADGVDVAVNTPVIGGEIKIKSSSGGDSQKLELGLPGGFQAKLIIPLLPQWDNFVAEMNKSAKDIGKNIGKVVSGVQSNMQDFLKNPIKSLQKTASKFNDDVHNTVNNIIHGNGLLGSNVKSILPNIKLNIPGIPNFFALIENAGGLLNELLSEGLVTQGQLIDIGGSVFKSALNNTVNAMAKLADTIESGVNMSVIDLSKAAHIVQLALDKGLQNTNGSADKIIKELLHSTDVTAQIGSKAASELSDLLADSVTNGILNTKSGFSVTATNQKSSSSLSNGDD